MSDLKHASGPVLVAEEPSAGSVAHLGRELTLAGKSPQARLRLGSASISRFHAALILDRGGVWLRDLSRRGNVEVNGRLVGEVDLRDGDRLKLGPFVFQIRHNMVLPDAPAPQAALLDAHDIETAINGRSLLIGRSEPCDLRLENTLVSRVHALIFAVGKMHYLRDLDSRSGTLVNGVAVRKASLSSGDVIQIGTESYRYVLKPQQAAPRQSLTVSEPLRQESAPYPHGTRRGSDDFGPGDFGPGDLAGKADPNPRSTAAANFVTRRSPNRKVDPRLIEAGPDVENDWSTRPTQQINSANQKAIAVPRSPVPHAASTTLPGVSSTPIAAVAGASGSTPDDLGSRSRTLEPGVLAPDWDLAHSGSGAVHALTGTIAITRVTVVRHDAEEYTVPHGLGRPQAGMYMLPRAATGQQAHSAVKSAARTDDIQSVAARDRFDQVGRGADSAIEPVEEPAEAKWTAHLQVSSMPPLLDIARDSANGRSLPHTPAHASTPWNGLSSLPDEPTNLATRSSLTGDDPREIEPLPPELMIRMLPTMSDTAHMNGDASSEFERTAVRRAALDSDQATIGGLVQMPDKGGRVRQTLVSMRAKTRRLLGVP